MRANIGALLDVNDPRHDGHAVEDSAVELAGQARGERPFSLVNDVGGAGLIVLVVPNVHLNRLRVVVAVLLEVVADVLLRAVLGQPLQLQPPPLRVLRLVLAITRVRLAVVAAQEVGARTRGAPAPVAALDDAVGLGVGQDLLERVVALLHNAVDVLGKGREAVVVGSREEVGAELLR